MSGRVYLLGVALALVGGALAVTHEVLGPWPGVTERNIRRVKPGMALEEVKAIFGRGCDGGISFGGPIGVLIWEGERIRFSARFNPDGILEDYRVAPRRDLAAPSTPLTWLRGWLGW